MEFDFKKLLLNPEILFMLAILVVLYIMKAVKDNKRGKEYDSIAASMRLSKLPAGKGIASIYGDEIARQFPGMASMVTHRYGGLFVSYAQGEFFRAESDTMETRTIHSRRGGSREVEQTNVNEYEGVYFDLGREYLPHFNMDFSVLRDLYTNTGAVQTGELSKFFDHKTLEIIVEGLPGVSICSTGNALMFYSDAYAVKDMRQFVQNASKAAELIIRS